MVERPAPHPDLDAAQDALMALTGVAICQAEIQRLNGALRGGASIKDAAQIVHDFFAQPIDWDEERRLLAGRQYCLRQPDPGL